MYAVVGQLIEAGSTNDTALKIGDGNSNQTHFVKVVSGTIKLGVESVHEDAHGFTSDDVVPPLTCTNGLLHFKAANASDTFVVTV